MPAADDEFRFLRDDAEALGLTGPNRAARRVEAATAAGAVSGLRFGADPAEATLLHGAGLNAHTFDAALLRLNRPALALDLPGHGRSDWRPDADYRPATLAPAVAAAIAALSDRPQLLVGQSLGGLTAARVAATRPELVRALVLVDISPGITPDDGGGRIAEFITGQRDFVDVEEVVARAIAFGIGSDPAALRRGVSLNTRRRADGRLEFSHHLAHLSAADGAAIAARDADLTPLWSDLAGLTVPVTLVRGDRGMIGDALLAEWRDRLPDSRVITLPAGHNVQDHDPRGLADALADALAG